MGRPEHRRGKAEQKIHRLRDGGQRGCDRQRQHSRRRAGAAALAGRGNERRRNAVIAKCFGKAGVHPDDLIRERQAHGVLRHGHGIRPGIGHGAHRQCAAQRRELERHIDQMMQAGRDEQPFQKTVQEHAHIAGSRDPARQRMDQPLKRRADKAGRQPQRRRKGHDAQKRPPQPGIQLRHHTGKLFFTGAVEDGRRRKANHNAACHPGVQHLDPQDGGLPCGGKAGQAVGVCQHPQRIQRRVVGGQEHQIRHERQQSGLLLLGLCPHRSRPHAQQQTEVVDNDHHSVIKQPARQFQRRPAQKRQHLLQRRTGQQCTGHHQQPCRRKIGQRRKQRLRKLLQLLLQFLHVLLPFSIPSSETSIL